jgi:hypothetical protein
MDSFQTLWTRFHPDAVPVGHTLEKNGTWNLTRFHLLPNGRDGTVSRQEYRQLIHRFNQLANDVLDEGAPVWLILPERSAPDWAPAEATDRKQEDRLHRLKRRFGLTKAWEYYSADDKCVYSISAGEFTWPEGGSARLFLDVHNERLKDIVLMNADTGAVIAPYTAGVYVSQPTPEALMALISNYYGWLPQDGTGLLRFNPAQTTKSSFQMSKSAAAAIQRALGT